MKKRNVKDKNNDLRARNERLTDKAVLISALAILYGVLLLFLQSMGYSTATASGAVTFVLILFWGSIVGAMVFAALAVYRERRDFLLYTGIFVYVLWTTAIIRFTGYWSHAYALVYISLFAAFILVHVNIWLRKTDRLEKTLPKVIFVVISALILIVLTLCSIGFRTGYLMNFYYSITAAL